MTSEAGIREFYRFLSPARRRQLHRVAALMLAGAVAEMAAVGAVFPFLAALAEPQAALGLPVIGDLLTGLGVTTAFQVIVACCLFFSTAALVAVTVRLWLLRVSQALVFQVGHDISQEVQRRVLAQEYLFHVSRNTSETLASLEKVQVLVFNVLLQFVLGCIALITAIFIAAILLSIDAWVAIGCIFVLGALYFSISLLTRQRLRRASSTMARAYDRRIQIVQESLGGIRDIIIDQSESVYLREFGRHDDDLQRARALSAFIGAAPRILIEGIGMILIAVVAAAIAFSAGGLQAALPVLGAFALGAQRLLPLVQQVYLAWTNLAANRAIVGDVLALLSLPLPPEASCEVTPAPFREQIRFVDVSFTYPVRGHPAVANVDLTIGKGTHMALIGTTGSGKSTLVDLLMGLLEPTSGEILVDGRPLQGSLRKAWQRNIAHVPQAIFLADTSIAHNIAFGCRPEEVDHDRVIAAAKTAQLDAFIATLPEGYDTAVGERGVRLSGGQRQRLGIARALYKDAPVLILDEATNALDEQTEARIMHAIANDPSARTLIVVSHRASTISACQLVVRVENGRISQTDAVPAAKDP